MATVSFELRIKSFLDDVHTMQTQKVFPRDINDLALLKKNFLFLNKKYRQLEEIGLSEEQHQEIESQMQDLTRRVNRIREVSYETLCDGAVTDLKKRDIEILVNTSEAIRRVLDLSKGPIHPSFAQSLAILCAWNMDKIRDPAMIPKAEAYLRGAVQTVQNYTL